MYLDLVKIVAASFVILSHSCEKILQMANGSIHWTVGNFVTEFTSIDVPLFFMVSGALILNSRKTADLKYVMKHRMIRLILPFLVWSILSVIFIQLLSNYFNGRDVLKSVIYLYNQPVLVSYWFMYALISFYLLSPILKPIVDHINDETMYYLIGLWFVTNIVFNSLAVALPAQIGRIFAAYSFGDLTFLVGNIGYFFVGYVLFKKDIKIKHLYTTFGFAMALMLLSNYVSNLHQLGSWQYLAFLAPILKPIVAALAFLVFKSLDDFLQTKNTKWLRVIEPITFGTYLTHGIIMKFLSNYIDPIHFFITFILTTLIAFVLVYLIRKIPVVGEKIT